MRPELPQPVAEHEPIDAADTGIANILNGREPCHVLLVDDDELVLRRLAAVLKDSDYLVRTARSREEALQLLDSDSLYQIKAGKTPFVFRKSNDPLNEVRQNGVVIPFDNGPVIQEGETNFSGFSVMQYRDSIVLRSRFDKKTAFNQLQWVIYPDGLLKMELHYFPSAYFTDYTGVNFSFPEQAIRSVKYMGFGPYRVWKNRMKGNRFGIWNKPYNNTETGEAWLYPEFKGYYANLYWCRFITSTIPFTVFTDTEDVFLRLFTPA